MSGNYVLDSNIVIDIFRGKQKTIQKISGINKFYIPVIVLGELYFGAHKANQTVLRIQQIQNFELTVNILLVNSTTASIYGEIKSQLKLIGKPIPENDIWIAAIAKESNLPIITKDKHFQHIQGLVIEDLS